MGKQKRHKCKHRQINHQYDKDGCKYFDTCVLYYHKDCINYDEDSNITKKYNTILIKMWRPNLRDNLGYKDDESFKYSKKQRNKIINRCLKFDLNVKLITEKDILIIYIDKGNLRQS